MNNKTDLTVGPILPLLIKLSSPIIGTSFIQMAYNLTDVLWLGRTGSVTVTAVTTAGFFLWLFISIFYCTKSGTETLVAQAIGKNNLPMASSAAENALTFSFIGSIVVIILLLIFSANLLQFFKLEADVMFQAVGYLRIVSIGLCFAAMNPVLSAIYVGGGNSKTPFVLNSAGLILNIILDPILIFGFWIIPELGANGAAIATVISHTVVFGLFIFKLRQPDSLLPRLRIIIPLQKTVLRKVLEIGVPISIHQIAFCLISMYIGRIVSVYGTIPLGVQNVGAAIEALSWNTALGFSTALAAFTGQNYGAGKYERLKKGYSSILFLSLSLGFIATIAFVYFGEEIFSLFSKEQEMIETGALYLQILAISQMFMCLEITSAGGFSGLGKTKPPSIVSVVFTGLRVPAALLVVHFTTYQYAGVWWCISLSSVFKGAIVPVLYIWTLRKLIKARTQSVLE